MAFRGGRPLDRQYGQASEADRQILVSSSLTMVSRSPTKWSNIHDPLKLPFSSPRALFTKSAKLLTRSPERSLHFDHAISSRDSVLEGKRGSALTTNHGDGRICWKRVASRVRWKGGGRILHCRARCRRLGVALKSYLRSNSPFMPDLETKTPKF